MSPVNTRDFQIKAPGGSIFARKWAPEKVSALAPIVLLHDSLGSVELWRGFPQALALGLSRTVIAYDRLGFGKSSPRHRLPPLDFIEEEAVEYFPAVKAGLSLSRYVLLGHSVGGAMAVNIAARDADCLGVVTAASQAFVEDLTVQGIETAKQAFKQPGQLDRLKKWHGDKASWVLRAWTDLWQSPEFASWSLEPVIGRVTCPVLAIHGDRDEYGSRAFPEFISCRAGGVSAMRILEDCGHMPHHEKTDEVISLVREFLAAQDW